jgi:hypothetical protein
MPTKRQLEDRERANAARRNEAAGGIIDATAGGHAAAEAQGAAVAAFGALADAIDAEAAAIREQRAKGWQTAATSLDCTAGHVRWWLDRVTEYKPPAGPPRPPLAPDTPLGSNHGSSPATLETKLTDAFGPELAPIRHIRTVLAGGGRGPEPEIAYGALCGEKTGSWTHPDGANCETCIALYQQEHPDWTPRRIGDGPVTPTVARQLREEIEAENAQPLETRSTEAVHISPDGVPSYGVGAPPAANTTQDKSIIERIVTTGEFPPERFAIGDTVTVAGVEFTKIGNDPFGEPAPPLMPAIVDARGPIVRERWTAAQVREHGRTRSRGDQHRSLSQLQSFSDCGTRYALDDMEAPAWWNVGGSALHRCVEEINRDTAAGTDITHEPGSTSVHHEVMWLRAFDAEIADQVAASPGWPMSAWRAAKKGSEHYDWWRVEGVNMVKLYVSWLSSMVKDGWEFVRDRNDVPVIEYPVQLDVQARVPVEGVVDFALWHPQAKQLLIVDVKAGASAPKDTLQLGEYGWALVMKLGVAPDYVRGTYYRARTGQTMPDWPVLTMHPYADIAQRFQEMDFIERQAVYMPNVTAFCGGCGVRDLCPAMAKDDNESST